MKKSQKNGLRWGSHQFWVRARAHFRLPSQVEALKLARVFESNHSTPLFEFPPIWRRFKLLISLILIPYEKQLNWRQTTSVFWSDIAMQFGRYQGWAPAGLRVRDPENFEMNPGKRKKIQNPKPGPENFQTRNSGFRAEPKNPARSGIFRKCFGIFHQM